ncbi:MAG: NAD(P)H-binding protein [Saprospiraceae bacterium]
MYVITGATGHTGKRITENLLAAGKSVRVIGRSADKLTDLVEKGATAAVGDLADVAFLTKAFEGATAVYLMIPPIWATKDWRADQRELTKAFVAALQAAKVSKVVLLSSQGAHMLTGAGPVSGIGELEQALRQVEGLHVLALRPGYFMENLFSSVNMIKHAGINGSVTNADALVTMVHTRNIAEVATQRLLDLYFTGHTHEFIGTINLSLQEVTRIIGEGIGKPELPYIQFSPADAKAGMLEAGLMESIADGYVELQQAINDPSYRAGYIRTDNILEPITLEWFVENELKPAFN